MIRRRGVRREEIDGSSGGDEGGLLVRHRQGDADAFAELVAEYRAPVYSYLVRCGVGTEFRDDLFQEIFLKVHRAAERYDPDQPLHPWVFTIVANTVRNHLRQRRMRELVFGRTRAEVDPRDFQPDSQRIAEAKQTATWLMGEIGRLPVKQRQVLLLACVESLPMKEIAVALEMPINTVKTCLRRARQALARSLADHRRGREEES